LTVVLSVLRFEAADYQFGIYKLFLALKLITHSLTEANQGCEIINQGCEIINQGCEIINQGCEIINQNTPL
jgi:hypothetical protein